MDLEQAGRLTWRHHNKGPTWDQSVRAELLTPNMETVGEIWRNAGHKYGWRVLKPTHWVVMDDHLSRATRPRGPLAVDSWAGWYQNRITAATGMVSYLHRRSIGLFNLDDLTIPPFNPGAKT